MLTNTKCTGMLLLVLSGCTQQHAAGMPEQRDGAVATPDDAGGTLQPTPDPADAAHVRDGGHDAAVDAGDEPGRHDAAVAMHDAGALEDASIETDAALSLDASDGDAEICTGGPSMSALAGTYRDSTGAEHWLRVTASAELYAIVPAGIPKATALPELWKVVDACPDQKRFTAQDDTGARMPFDLSWITQSKAGTP